MIYLDCKHSDGSITSYKCQNWAEMAFTIEAARDIFQFDKINVTENKISHEEKVREWLE